MYSSKLLELTSCGENISHLTFQQKTSQLSNTRASTSHANPYVVLTCVSTDWNDLTNNCRKIAVTLTDHDWDVRQPVHHTHVPIFRI